MVGAKSTVGKSDRAEAMLCSVVNDGNNSVNTAIHYGNRTRKNRKSSEVCLDFVVEGNVIVICIKYLNCTVKGVINSTNVENRAVGIGSMPLVTVCQLKLAEV